MIRYIAFLRGVSPMNLRMAQLARSVEKMGGRRVKTLLSSGNVAFDHDSKSARKVEQLIEASLAEIVGRPFYTIVRTTRELQELVAAEPFSRYTLPEEAKRVITFARKLRPPKNKLPVKRDGAQILTADGRQAFSFYVPGPEGPAFMRVIEENFGAEITTRTWDTVRKCANG